MNNCSKCHKEIEGVEVWTCNYCKLKHCDNCRLPEDHNCKGIIKNEWKIDRIRDIINNESYSDYYDPKVYTSREGGFPVQIKKPNIIVRFLKRLTAMFED